MAAPKVIVPLPSSAFVDAIFFPVVSANDRDYCTHRSRYGQLGKTARMYYFTYGPSCSDKADSAWGTTSPYRKSEAGGGWASHASEIAYVFGNSFDSCDPTTEDRYGAGSSLRLTTAMQQLWTSFAKTGEPRADPDLFTGT